MPGSVANAAVAAGTVLPQLLCSAFSHSRQYRTLVNEYLNGESQRQSLTDSSGKAWQISRRLTPAETTALANFYNARRGPLEAFYMYDPFEVGSVYDSTGVATTGRHTVHFSGPLTLAVMLGRGEGQFGLVELA